MANPRPSPSTLHIELLGQMIADLHDHRDAFGIAGLGSRRLVGLGAEFPGVLPAENGNADPSHSVGVNHEFSSCHSASVLVGLLVATCPLCTSVGRQVACSGARPSRG